MTCGLPTFAPLAETKEFQEKGGVQISIAPNTFQCSVVNLVQETEIVPELFSELQLAGRPNGDVQHYKRVKRVTTPAYQVNPNKVSFRLKISNKMPRVFRGSGTVLLYNFGGKNTSVSQQDYAELTNLIVPPRTEAEVVVYGPPFTDIPQKTTLGLFLYDVITKTDTAGNITDKQNFEWYYNYAVQAKEEVGEVVRETLWVPR